MKCTNTCICRVSFIYILTGFHEYAKNPLFLSTVAMQQRKKKSQAAKRLETPETSCSSMWRVLSSILKKLDITLVDFL